MLHRVVVEETIRRHVTHVGYLTYLALIAIVALGMSRFDAPAAAWPTLIGLLAIIAGCGPIGPEFSSGTLQLILVKPVNRASYLLSRVVGVVSVIWIAAIVAFLVEVIGRATRGQIPFDRMATTLLNVAVVSVLTVALLTLFGSLTRAYINVALYVVLSIALNLLHAAFMIGGRFPQLAKIVSVIDQNLYPEASAQFDPQWILLVLSNAAVALLLACLLFRKREVPYGAD